MQGRPGPAVIALPEDSDHSGRTHLHRGPVADDKDVAGPSAEQRAEADHVGDALLVRDILPAPALYSSDHAKAGSGQLRIYDPAVDTGRDLNSVNEPSIFAYCADRDVILSAAIDGLEVDEISISSVIECKAITASARRR